MKVVINVCFGGFGLSLQATRLFAKRKGVDLTFYTQTKYAFMEGRDEYTRVEAPERGALVYALTEDLGEVIASIPYDDRHWYPSIERNDPNLLAVIDELGPAVASGDYAKLKVVDIPDGVEWEIEDYDGNERIHEAHQTWG